MEKTVYAGRELYLTAMMDVDWGTSLSISLLPVYIREKYELIDVNSCNVAKLTCRRCQENRHCKEARTPAMKLLAQPHLQVF